MVFIISQPFKVEIPIFSYLIPLYPIFHYSLNIVNEPLIKSSFRWHVCLPLWYTHSTFSVELYLISFTAPQNCFIAASTCKAAPPILVKLVMVNFLSRNDFWTLYVEWNVCRNMIPYIFIISHASKPLLLLV